MEHVKRNCTGMDSKLADMLLDPAAAPAKVRSHVAECEDCRARLAEMQATVDLLDAWEVPQPSPYFLSRLDARMLEERQAAPAGWFARLRARYAYGPPMPVRPLAAMALTVMLLIGGGAYLGVTDWNQPAPTPSQAAVVQDLQILDNNAQLLNQLEALSSNDNGD